MKAKENMQEEKRRALEDAEASVEESGEVKRDGKNHAGVNMKPIISTFYLFLSIVVAVLGILHGQEISKILVHGVLVWMLMLILVLVLSMDEKKYYKGLVSPKIFLTGFILACVMMLVSYFANTFNLWLVGVVLIAVVGGYESALFLHIILTVVYATGFSLSIEEFAYYLIIGSIICLVCSRLKNIAMIGYSLLIGICSDLSLQFILHEFDVTKVLCRYSLFSVLSTVGVIVIAYLLNVIFGTEEQAGEEEGESAFLSDSAKMEEEKEDEQKLTKKLMPVLEQEYPLQQELQAFSKTLYMHSVDVGELSGMAAESIGYDGLLARAGGLYHEIGRIKGENYIEEGVKIAEEHDFPDELTDIIRQHNAKSEKPASVEAAIVMLTDSIVSTLEYLESIGKQGSIPSEKLVKNVFENRLAKGNLDDCGLTVVDYQKLISFYTENSF